MPDAHVVGVIGSGTLSRSVLDGDDLSPGCHINVMGSYKLDMQELDEKTVKRAAFIAIDIPEDTAQETGDLITQEYC